MLKYKRGDKVRVVQARLKNLYGELGVIHAAVSDSLYWVTLPRRDDGVGPWLFSTFDLEPAQNFTSALKEIVNG